MVIQFAGPELNHRSSLSPARNGASRGSVPASVAGTKGHALFRPPRVSPAAGGDPSGGPRRTILFTDSQVIPIDAVHFS